jgi:hypothetical protein
VHLSFQFLLAYPMEELFRLGAGIRGWLVYYLPVMTVLGLSGLWEIIESWVAGVVHPELGITYLGSQGDVWDAQKDMAAALYGALLCMTLIAIARAPCRPQPAFELSLQSGHPHLPGGCQPERCAAKRSPVLRASPVVRAALDLVGHRAGQSELFSKSARCRSSHSSGRRCSAIYLITLFMTLRRGTLPMRGAARLLAQDLCALSRIRLIGMHFIRRAVGVSVRELLVRLAGSAGWSYLPVSAIPAQSGLFEVIESVVAVVGVWGTYRTQRTVGCAEGHGVGLRRCVAGHGRYSRRGEKQGRPQIATQ